MVATTYCNIWPAIDGCARHVELQKPFFTSMQEIRELLLLYIDGCALAERIENGQLCCPVSVKTAVVALVNIFAGGSTANSCTAPLISLMDLLSTWLGHW